MEVTGFYSVEVTNEYGCAPLSEELQVVISGVNEPNVLHMAVMPNPMSEAARIIFSEAVNTGMRIELMDVNGRIVRTMNGNGTREVRIERKGISSGLYLFRVLDADGSSAQVRLVVD